jgi:hypothetical protein
MEYLTIPDYKEWTPGLYLVDAGCNAGKSTFVIKELYPFAKEQHKRILMFSNRLALKGQQELLTQDTDIMLMTYQKLEFNQRQQGIEVISTYQPEDLMPLVEQFDYLVLDEAHYLFQDASFNLATETIVKMVDHYRDSKIVLMLSATPQLLQEYYGAKIDKTYTVERDYSHIKKLYAYSDREAVYKIINDVPKDEKIIFFGDSKKRLKNLHIMYEDSSYLEGQNKETNPVFRQIVTNERFDCRILFTTKVLDNGINLKDNSIKHIIIDLSDLTEFIQCLGRRRILNTDEGITVYFYSGIDSISGRYGDLKKAMRVAEEYYTVKDYNFESFSNKYRFVPNMPKFFDNTMHIVYPAYFKARYDFRFYRSIIKKETSMIDEVEKLLKIPCLLYEKVSKDYRLTQYLESNIGKKFFKPDREVLIEVFDLKKDGHLLKSRKMLNQYLKEYGFKYHINDGKEKRKAYWVIEKSSLM